MKSRDGQRQREEKSRREQIREEKESEERRCRCAKGRKVAKHRLFQWFVAPEGRKVSSLKQRVRSHLARRWKIARCCGGKHICKSKCTKYTRIGPLLEVEMLKKCTPVWCEAHFQVKMYKAHQLRTTFGSWDVEKMNAFVVRSTFWTQIVQSTPAPDHIWKLRCRKSARHCGAKHILKSKVQKTDGYGALFGRSDVLSRGRRKGLCTLSKVSKTWGFCSMSKSDVRHGTFEEDLQRCILHGRRSTKDMFIRDVRRSGRWFPERGRILERQIFRFAEMILHDRCSTSYDLAALFRGRRSTFDRWTKNIKTHWYEAVSSALNFPFLKEVSQNCFVFDVVKLKKWRSFAEVLRLWCCQLWKIRKSRRIASFFMLSTSKNEEVSQKCCVFDVVNLEKWRSLVEQIESDRVR